MMNEIYTAIHSIISVTVLFILTRMMGKKQISQLTFFDYVVGITIGSIAAMVAIDQSIGYVKGITGLIIYALFPIMSSYISIKNYSLRKLLDGTPTILIQNGKIVECNLRKSKMTVNDLLEECRLKNAFNIMDVEYAILETSGKLSVQLKSCNQPLTPKDMNIQTAYNSLCVNVIIDGKILEDHLRILNKDINWLNTELKKQGVNNYTEILVAYIDSQNILISHLNNEKINVTPIM